MMGVGFWILGAGLIVAAGCLAYGRKNGADIDDALVRASATATGGLMLASDLTGWLIYLAV